LADGPKRGLNAMNLQTLAEIVHLPCGSIESMRGWWGMKYREERSS